MKISFVALFCAIVGVSQAHFEFPKVDTPEFKQIAKQLDTFMKDAENKIPGLAEQMKALQECIKRTNDPIKCGKELLAKFGLENSDIMERYMGIAKLYQHGTTIVRQCQEDQLCQKEGASHTLRQMVLQMREALGSILADPHHSKDPQYASIVAILDRLDGAINSEAIEQQSFDDSISELSDAMKKIRIKNAFVSFTDSNGKIQPVEENEPEAK